MLMPDQTPTRGDVVATGKLRAVVWANVTESLFLLPIAVSEGPAHRGDVTVDGFADLAECGYGVKTRGVRIKTACGLQCGTHGHEVLGRLSDATIGRIETAIARSAEAERVEGRWPRPTAREREIRARNCAVC